MQNRTISLNLIKMVSQIKKIVYWLSADFSQTGHDILDNFSQQWSTIPKLNNINHYIIILLSI